VPTVEDGIQAQLRNIEKTYDRTIDELVAVVVDSGLAKHSEVVSMLCVPFAGRLRAAETFTPSRLFTHRVRVATVAEIDKLLVA
jgi:hypothetical protein